MLVAVVQAADHDLQQEAPLGAVEDRDQALVDRRIDDQRAHRALALLIFSLIALRLATAARRSCSVSWRSLWSSGVRAPGCPACRGRRPRDRRPRADCAPRSAGRRGRRGTSDRREGRAGAPAHARAARPSALMRSIAATKRFAEAVLFGRDEHPDGTLPLLDPVDHASRRRDQLVDPAQRDRLLVEERVGQAATVLDLIDHASAELARPSRAASSIIFDWLTVSAVVAQESRRGPPRSSWSGRPRRSSALMSVGSRGDQHLAGRHAGGAAVRHGDLDDPVAEQSLGLDPRHGVLADPIGELPADGEIDPDLAAGLRRAGVTSVTRPICTPARRTVAPSRRPPTSVKSAWIV